MNELYTRGIDKEVLIQYNLEIRGIANYKDAYILNTSAGRKLLKKSPLSSGRLLFIHGAKEHLFNNGFHNVDRYLCSSEGKPFISVDEDNYVLTDFIDGNECNFDNRNDIVQVSRLLAKLHRASRGYVPPQNSKPRDDLGKAPTFFCKRLDEIKKLKKIAKKGRSKFDYLFLEHFDYFCGLGDNAIKMILNSKYDELVEEARKEGIFCHHDFTYHNIMCSGDKYMVKNFDLCCFELKVYDIANLIRRKMRKCSWNIDEARVILDEYKSIEPISRDEFTILKIILQFPQKFWRVVNKYYNSRRSWSEKSFIVKLQEVIDEREHHGQFIESFDSLI